MSTTSREYRALVDHICPVCFKGTATVREWQGDWVSVAGGEALTNWHFDVVTSCGCRLSSTQWAHLYNRSDTLATETKGTYELQLLDRSAIIISRDWFDDEGEARGNFERAKAMLQAGESSNPKAHGLWLRNAKTRESMLLFFEQTEVRR